jgi:BirA family transcriptional regulator, biotin operon repressor / biotin---[acetyl-CoA-carboxylase] ligase
MVSVRTGWKMAAEFSDTTLKVALAPRAVRFYEQVGSTNDLALDWLRDGAAAGSVVIADEQTNGRGRLGRSWFAPPGTALMLSIVLHPDAGTLSRVGMLGALSVCETLEGLGAKDAGIKWPNDVRLGERKVCGVLPEAAWDGNRLLGAVLGIGLNVRIPFENTDLDAIAVSLEPALGVRVDRLDVLERLLERVDYWSAQLASSHLFEAWKTRLTTLGQRVKHTGTDGPIEGTAENVDDQGALLLRLDDGQTYRVVAGDIALGEQGYGHGN